MEQHRTKHVEYPNEFHLEFEVASNGWVQKPWKYLSSKGIGIYPKKILLKKKNYPKLQFKRFLKNLHTIGYRYLNTNLKKKIIKNFQRRFRQRKINGILDLETMKISQFLSKNQK